MGSLFNRLNEKISSTIDSLKYRTGWLASRMKRKSGIVPLMYHDVSPSPDTGYPYSVSLESFRRQLDLLDELGTLVAPDAIFGEIERNNGPKFLLTFDDGYADFLEHVHPVLEDRGVAALLFVTTKFLDSDMETFLNWDQLKELSAGTRVEIGSHGMTHWNLLALTNKDARREIMESKKLLEGHLDRRVSFFAYPSGGHSSGVEEWVREAGYDAAYLDRFDSTVSNNRYALGRVGIDKTNTEPSECLASLKDVRDPVSPFHTD